MTALLGFLRFAWPYVLCTLVGIYLTHAFIDAPRYDALQATYAKYQAQVAQADVKALQTAKDAVEAQIQTRLQTEANNGKVIQQLQAERDSAAADRDFARRLLAAAQAKSTPAGDPMPASTGRSGPDGGAGTPGNRSLATDLGDAAGECRTAIQRLAALQAELQPQLR